MASALTKSKLIARISKENQQLSPRDVELAVKTLIDYLQGGDRLKDFLNDFPTVTKDHALRVLDLAKDALLSNLDETQVS